MRAGYGRGWKYVGYHFFIRQDGTIEKGRNLETTPAAQGRYKDKYYNKGSIAICLSGGQHEKLDSFTQKQFNSLGTFCQKINDSYNKKISFHGHREVSAKKCPVFDYKKVLDLDNNGYIIYYSSIESKPAKLPELNAKKTMPLPLLAGLVLPMITKLGIKGFDKLKDKAKNTVFKLILKKTGINLGNNPTPEDVESAVNKLPPEEQLKLKTQIISSQSELLKAAMENQTEQARIVNDTMRLEMQGKSWIQRYWRPINGICFAISVFFMAVGSVVLNAYGIFYSRPEIATMISLVNQSLMAIMTLQAAVVGITAGGRSFEKIEALKKMG